MSRATRPIPVGMPAYVAALALRLQALPGIGEKAAMRHAVNLALGDPERACGLADVLAHLHERVGPCGHCGGLGDRGIADPSEGIVFKCAICADSKRDTSIVCVVARVQDMLAIERSGAMRGRYVVLGGLVSPVEGVELGDLRATLIREAIHNGATEVILALPASVDGEATALMLQRELADTGVRLSRIASGVPHGGDLEFADPVTLVAAVKGRGEVKA